jgi:hypothetical protein
VANRFNFYDFLGYIIPGSFVAVLLVYAIGAICGDAALFLKYASGVGETIIFLVLGYLIGHLIQARGKQIEDKEKKSWGGFFSVRFLKENDLHYMPDYKKLLKENAAQHFDLSVDLSGEGITDEMKDHRYQDIFDLCYEFDIQKGISRQVDTHNAIYGMFRGMLAVREIGIALASIVTLRNIIVMANYWFAKAQVNYDLEIPNLIIGVAILAFFITIGPFLQKRLEQVARRFADSVYRSFLAYCLTETSPKDNKVSGE